MSTSFSNPSSRTRTPIEAEAYELPDDIEVYSRERDYERGPGREAFDEDEEGYGVGVEGGQDSGTGIGTGSRGVSAPLLQQMGTTNTTGTRSHYHLARSEQLRGIANRIIFSRYYVLFYGVMMVLSMATVVLSLIARRELRWL